MNKAGLAAAIAEKTGFRKRDIVAMLTAMTEVITEELQAGNDVHLVGFGTFEATEKEERIRRNPKTGEEIALPITKSLRFKPGRTLKDTLRQGEGK